MSDQSRRGFLGTLSAALVGAAATFDPLRGLWVPQSTGKIAPTAGLEELNDLALCFAQMMAGRLADRRASEVIRSVTYESRSFVALPPSLRVVGLRPGMFVPAPRTAKTGQVGSRRSDYLDTMADQTMRALRGTQVNIFAPMSKDLRPGTVFTNALVTVVGDPSSGLSVRAMRFKDASSGHLMTLVELAGGHWRLRHAFTPNPDGVDEPCDDCDELRSHEIHHHLSPILS